MKLYPLEELCRAADNIGVDELAILRFVQQGRGEKNKNLLGLSESEVGDLLGIIEKIRKKYKFIRLGCPIDFSLKCKIGHNTLTIRPDGEVTLCPAFKYKKIVGNIKKRDLKWIWSNSPVLKAVRKSGNDNCLAQCFYNNGKDPWKI